MQVLFNSIYSKFTGSTGAGSLYTLLGGRLHLTEAPQGSAFPYGVYHLISLIPMETFSEKIYNAVVQFNLIDDDNSATDINTAYSALNTLYDRASLNITGHTWIDSKMDISSLVRVEDIWNFMIQYRILYQED